MRAVWSIWLLVGACTLPDIRDCPCAEGWICRAPEMRCVRGMADDASIDADLDADLDAGPSGPVAHWTCDALDGTTMRDETGNEHDARCDAAGCPMLVDDPERGRVCLFGPGETSAPRLRVSHDDDFVSDAFTVALWAHPAGTNSGSAIGKPYAAGRANSWQMFFVRSDGQLLARFVSAVCPAPEDDCPSVGGETITGLAGTPVATDAWVHFTIVWDGSTQIAYVDGVETESQPGDIDFDTRDITIGADDNGGEVDLPFPGMLDDIRIYDRALTPEEIAALAGMG